MTGEQALTMIQRELGRAIIKHPTFPTDVVYMTAILAEETGESVQAALDYQLDGGGTLQMHALQKEVAQAGAMAFRILMSLGRIEI